jgi:hypothetical protein
MRLEKKIGLFLIILYLCFERVFFYKNPGIHQHLRKILSFMSNLVLVLFSFSLTYCQTTENLELYNLVEKQEVKLENIRSLINKFDIVAVGETHALLEPIKTIKTIITAVHSEKPFTHLLLEMSVSDQKKIDKYMSGDDYSLDEIYCSLPNCPLKNKEFFSIFSFIRELNRKNPKHQILVKCIDVNSPIRNIESEKRNQYMFEKVKDVLSTHKKPRVLIYVGANHAAKVGQDLFNQATLASRLKKNYPASFYSLLVLDSKASFWQKLIQNKKIKAPFVLPLRPRLIKLDEIFFQSKWWKYKNEKNIDAFEVFDAIIVWPIMTSIAGKDPEIFIPCANDPKKYELRTRELQALLKADQDDRKQASISPQLAFRDRKRRMRVGEIFGEGCFKSANDFSAAALIFQHGDKQEHFYQTFIWSKKSYELGNIKSKELMALAIDRYLISLGHKQLFGSQAFKLSDDICYCLQPVETTFPDSMRMKYIGVKLSKKYEWVDQLNLGKRCPSKNICNTSLKSTPKSLMSGFW